MNSKLLFCLALVLSSRIYLKRTGLLAMLFTVMVAIPLLIQAKSVDFSAHFARESYWSDHVIYLARITDIKHPTNAPYATSFVPIRFISGSVAVTNHDILSYPGPPVIDFTGVINNQPERFPIGVAPGDLILVSEAVKGQQLTVVKVVRSSATDPLVKALRTIAAIRVNPAPAVLLSNALDTNALVLVSGQIRSLNHAFSAENPGNDYLVPTYCLERLLRLPELHLTQDDVTKLEQAEENNNLGLRTRLMAARLVLKCSPNLINSNYEYVWLKTLLTNAATQGPPYSYQLIETFVAIPDHRKETIKYLSSLAESAKMTGNNLGMITFGLSSPHLFNYDNPDKDSRHIFSLGLTLLKASAPDKRLNGATLLYSVIIQINPSQRKPYLNEGIAALNAACRVESDKINLMVMKNRLTILRQDR